MFKVLVVEDDGDLQYHYAEELNGKVEVISALSIEEAKEKFSQNPDINAIVMDACVPGDSVTTEPLTREFRKNFSGPIIAISSLSSFRNLLISAGCNYQSEKMELPQKVLEVLNLT